MKKCFVLVHFGNQSKYFEYELYTLIMLNKYSKADIVYMYSINDTPFVFIQTIKSLFINYPNIKLIPYDDLNITYGINFTSNYEHFNTLRTCNFIFALKLIEYDKICVIESDMIFLSNKLDEIFNLKCPSVLCYEKNINTNTNSKIKIELPITMSKINGGVFLFKPSELKFNKALKKIKKIVKHSMPFPNEILIMKLYKKKLYNLPAKYNFSRYNKNHIYDVVISHYDNTQQKPLDRIKTKPINEKRNHLIKYLKHFYEQIYLPNHEQIDEIIKTIST